MAEHLICNLEVVGSTPIGGFVGTRCQAMAGHARTPDFPWFWVSAGLLSNLPGDGRRWHRMAVRASCALRIHCARLSDGRGCRALLRLIVSRSGRRQHHRNGLHRYRWQCAQRRQLIDQSDVRVAIHRQRDGGMAGKILRHNRRPTGSQLLYFRNPSINCANALGLYC
jgi:hypothetical protein